MLLQSPELLALAAALLFGLALVLTQFALGHASPLHGALISLTTSSVLFCVLAAFVFDLGGFDPRGAMIFVGVGLLFPAAVTLLTYEANRRMGPSVAGTLANLTPLFAILPAALLFGEVPRPTQMLAIALIVIGAAMLSLDRRWLGRRWQAWALILPIGAAAIRGLTQPMTKFGYGFWPNPFAATLIAYLTSLTVIATVVLAARRGQWFGYTLSGVLWFACIGVCNGLAVLALYAALARGSVIVVSPLAASYPIVTLALSAAFLRTARIGPLLVGGVVFTVAGVMLMLRA